MSDIFETLLILILSSEQSLEVLSLSYALRPISTRLVCSEVYLRPVNYPTSLIKKVGIINSQQLIITLDINIFRVLHTEFSIQVVG